MKKLRNFVDPDNKWAPNSTMAVDWTIPEAYLIYGPREEIISTMPFKAPIGYDVTPR